jgi:hypothetical protein
MLATLQNKLPNGSIAFTATGGRNGACATLIRVRAKKQ